MLISENDAAPETSLLSLARASDRPLSKKSNAGHRVRNSPSKRGYANARSKRKASLLTCTLSTCYPPAAIASPTPKRAARHVGATSVLQGSRAHARKIAKIDKMNSFHGPPWRVARQCCTQACGLAFSPAEGRTECQLRPARGSSRACAPARYFRHYVRAPVINLSYRRRARGHGARVMPGVASYFETATLRRPDALALTHLIPGPWVWLRPRARRA